MELIQSHEENLSMFPPDDGNVVLRPDQCVCCKLSKTQGTFFALGRHRWESRPWEASGSTFQAAAKEGCRRCGFVLDNVLAYMNAMGALGLRWVRVWNGVWRFGTPRAAVYTSLSCAGFSKFRTLKLSHPPDGVYGLDRLPWNIALAPALVEDPACEQALAPAKVWMKECLETHEECQTHAPSRLPRRVLELSGTMMYLRDDTKHKLTSNYACLSHCWGEKGPSIRLTSSSASRLKEGIRIATLPKTFYEAAKVCLQLGISYLWIDALCIYQDDLQDWTSCASEMSSIYTNAQMTIAATSARNSNDGLRHLAKDRFRSILVPSTGLCIQEHRRAHGFDSESKELRPLTTRAWAFQEHRLSTRVLSFSICQLTWECRHSCYIEGDDVPPARSSLQPQPEQHSASAWHNVVRAYSQLQITFDSDRLPALAAVAEKTNSLRNDSDDNDNDMYLAGLWRSTLLCDLQWRIYSSDIRTHRCNSHTPSWSWASVHGGVIFSDHFNHFKPLPDAEVLDVSYTPVGPAHMGMSAESRITLKGRVGRVERQKATAYADGFRLYASSAADIRALGTDIKLFAWPDFGLVDSTMVVGADALSGGERLVVLFMTFEEQRVFFKSFGGLLLRQNSDASSYERIGWLDVSYQGQLSQWNTEDALPHEGEDLSSSGAEGIFARSETPVDKYMSTLPLESVAIV